MDFLPHEKLQQLIDALKQAGYAVIGPQVRDGAIVYDTLECAEQLPWGVREQQAPGNYHLEKISEQEAFAWANGPQALKPLLFKARETVWKVNRDEHGKLVFIPMTAKELPMAVIGARACDLVGMAIQDKIFIEGKHVDVRYQERRKNLFVVAVICTYSAKNCFCVSAGTGPQAETNYDIKMVELNNGFIIESGSEKGKYIIDKLKLRKAKIEQISQAEQRVDNAANMQTKRISFNNSRALRDVLFNNLDHPRWDNIASRCLSCTNCTQVCPTCFCHDENDKAPLDGSTTEHIREWDSCFTADHSYITGKVIRDDTRKRYRQWLTHKVGSWHDQFGTSGCVGCGRCITWCPVGIDITEELAAITGESNER